LLRTPSCLQQRQFSIQTRLRDDEKSRKGKEVGAKDEEAYEKELELRAEEASKKEELVPETEKEAAVFEDVELPTKDEPVLEPPINLPTNEDPVAATEELSKNEPALSNDVEPSKKAEIVPNGQAIPINRLGKTRFDEEETEDDFEMTPEGEATIKVWQQELGISDERLAYLVDTYPGIDAPLIEAVHKGKIPEESLLGFLEEAQAEEEADLPPEAQAKLHNLSKHYDDFGKDLFEDNPNFDETELKQLGLRKSDIDALNNDTAELSEAQTVRIGRAMRRAGLSEEEFAAITDVEESGLRKDNEQYEKETGLDQLEEPELEEPQNQIDVYTKVMEEIEALQARTGLSDEKVMHYVQKFDGQVTADLIEAAETKRISEDRMEYYIKKYGGTYPMPLDSSLILAMDKGEIEEEAFNHVRESIMNPPPELIKAVFKGEITTEEVNDLCEKYGVPAHIVGSLHKGDITENQVQNFVEEFPGVEPDVQLLNDIGKGVYDAGLLDNLKNLGKLYPNVMSAEYWRGVLAGDITQEQLDKTEKAQEDDVWDIPEDALRAWQEEYGISDKMLEFLRDTYPGIWPDLVTAFAKGEIKESDIPKLIDSEEPWQMPKTIIDRWLEEHDIPEMRMKELREKFPKIWPELLAEVVKGEVKEEDVERIIEEDAATEDDDANNPWAQAGVTPENVQAWQEENGVSDEMLEYLTKTYPDITPDIVADFAEGVIEQKDIPEAIKQYQKEQGKEEGEVQKEAKELEIPSQVEGETMAERIEWYQSRFPGIDIETITLAEMGLIPEAAIPEVVRNIPSVNSNQDGMRAELLKQTPADLRKIGGGIRKDLLVDEEDDEEEESPMERARKIKDGPLTKALPINGGKMADIENMGMDEFYQMMIAEGIDPNKMNEKEIFKMMDEKFAMKDYEHTDEEGDTLRYITPKSPEELKKIEAGLGNPMEPMIFDPPGMGDREWANELNDGDSSQEEAEIEQGLDEMFGTLSKDEIEEDKKERVEEGFFNYGEDNPKDVGEDEEFQGDDISTQGHEELEQHRELREYARLAAWELPLLHSMLAYPSLKIHHTNSLTELAKPFEPPKQNQPLRFRYTTYFGAQHPADKKVVVEFAPNDIPNLTDIQRMKMIKLAGVRYNPSTGLIKMASESMETQAQNKRYLGDLVSKLIKESKDPKDTFEDVPVDFRHHTPKPFHKLPERWKLTPERKRQLEEKRRKVLEEERMKKDTGKLVDGLGVIEQAMKRLGMAQLQEKKNAMTGAKVAVPTGRRMPVRGKVGQPLPGRK
jgi:hypothetical protein